MRALFLRCPVCGKSPLFCRISEIRSLQDWFTPLDGCPRCGYPYEREPGYYLLAVWMINYGSASALGLFLYTVLEWRFHLSIEQLLAAVLVPVFAFCLLFARHAKAFFLAFDLYFDPHERGGGDDGGNQRRGDPPVTPAPSHAKPIKPCERPAAVR